jgi:aminoglycoside 3-N-acetyltransferase
MNRTPLRFLPDAVAFRLIAIDRHRVWARARRAAPLTNEAVRELLRGPLGVERGDCVCVHSSLGALNIAMTPADLLDTLLDTVGPEGTLALPTFPKLASYDFLRRGDVFDLHRTPSGMGILTETARRHADAVRSLHPTKSVVAIGRHARALTDNHAACALSFDRESPFHRLIDLDAKLIGLGVWTYNCSFVHVSDDALRGVLPVCPYDSKLYQAPCIDSDGRRVVVPAFAHSSRIARDTATVNSYVKHHIDPMVLRDVTISDRRLFIGRARALFSAMCANARKGIHMYPRLATHSSAEAERQRWRAIEKALVAV